MGVFFEKSFRVPRLVLKIEKRMYILCRIRYLKGYRFLNNIILRAKKFQKNTMTVEISLDII